MSRALERDIFSAEERKRVASAFMNRRPPHGRVVTAGNELRKKYINAKSNNMLGTSGPARQSQMELAQSTSAYHRQLVHIQQAKKEKAEQMLPNFVKQSSHGRVSSHMGNRQKYQRLLNKNLQARDTTKVYDLKKEVGESFKDTASQSQAAGNAGRITRPAGVTQSFF